LIAEEKSRREARIRVQREKEIRESLEPYYRNLELRKSECTLDKPEGNVSERISHTPPPPRPVPSQSEPSASKPATSSRNTTADTSEEIASRTLEKRRADAATKIQSFYRLHKTLANISQLEAKFEELKHGFTLPEAIDYVSANGDVITLTVDAAAIPTQLETSSESAISGKLAFTPTNIPIRVYDEELNRVLAKLDAVESWGEKKVREKRRSVVRSVELEAARIETIWAEIWKKFVEKGEEEEVDVALADKPSVNSAIADEESNAMTVDTSSTPASSDVLSSTAEPETSDRTEDASFITSHTSPSLAEQKSIVPFPTESTVEELIESQPVLPMDLSPQTASILDITENAPLLEGEASEASGSESGDYESVGLVVSEQDQDDHSDNGSGEDDFVML